MTPRASRLLTLLLPVAIAGSAELALGLVSAARERAYVARLGGGLLLAEILAAALAGLAWHRLRRHVPPRGHAAVALGLTVALATLTILANGLPRRLPPGTLPPAAAWTAAGILGLLAWGLRRSLPGGAAAPRPWEPLLAAAALVGGYGGLRLTYLPPASLAGARAWAGVLAVAVALMVLTSWLAAHRQARTATGAVAVGLATALALTSLAAGRRPYPGLPAGTGTGPPDILLVVLDTVRADHAPAPAGSRWPTPALARLAREGDTGSAVFSTSCWTVPAHASLFTGRLPLGHGAGWSDPRLPATGGATLAERLAAAGWRTAGFSANPWIASEFGFDRGFARFVEADADRRPLRPWASAFLPAAATAPALDLYEDKGGLALTSEALRFLAEDDSRPAFVFLNLLEPHLPYWPPRRWRQRAARLLGRSHRQLQQVRQEPLAGLTEGGPAVLAQQLPVLGDLYAAEVAYADFLLGRLLARLEQAGRLDRTLVVVTSDHGENLGDHPPLDHQLGLYDTLVRVPLLVREPPPGGGPLPDRAGGLLSLADLPALILSRAGVADASDPPAREAVFLQYDRPGPILERMRGLGLDPAPWDRRLDGIRTGDAKWVRASDGRHQAFDLGADPGEQDDPAARLGDPAFLDLARRLEERLPADRVGRPATVPDIDPRTIERLRSLGYMD